MASIPNQQAIPNQQEEVVADAHEDIRQMDAQAYLEHIAALYNEVQELKTQIHTLRVQAEQEISKPARTSRHCCQRAASATRRAA